MAPSILSFLTILTFLVAIDASRELSSTIDADRPKPKPRTTVRITNQVGNEVKLTMHCQSKDDDLGFHTLAPGTSWEFNFHPQFFVRTTLFFCRMEWPGSVRYFDVYQQTRDEEWCHNECFWNIFADGPTDSISAKSYPWNP